MSRIRSRGNRGTELALIQYFRSHHISRWRRHWPLVGKPDFVFPRSRLVIFVDGCFWHRCPKHGTQPTTNRKYWKKKFARNKARDRLVNRTLRRLGWRIVRVWQHELKRKNESRLMRRIQQQLQNSARKYS